MAAAELAFVKSVIVPGGATERRIRRRGGDGSQRGVATHNRNKFNPAHGLHVCVADNQAEVGAAHSGQRFVAAGRLNGRIKVQLPREAGNDLAHDLVIVDDEERAA
jgi:hypothetical protein